MKTSVVIKELEGIARFAQQDGTFLDFRDQGQHCFFIDNSLKILKNGAKYRLTIEVIVDTEEDVCHISMES